MQFSEIQERIIQSRGKNITVSASAGAGKTSVLVERLKRLIVEDHINVDRILAITFTNDAAGEMKSRLKSQLAGIPDQDNWLRDQLALLETARICTIDSFCADLLSRYYYCLDLPYAMTKTLISPAQKNAALDQAYQQALKNLDPDSFARLKLFLQAYSRDDAFLQQTMLRFIEMANAKPDPQAWIASLNQPDELMEVYFRKYFAMNLEAMLDTAQSLYNEILQEEYVRETKKNTDLKAIEQKLNSLNHLLLILEKEKYSIFRQEYLADLASLPSISRSYNKHDYSAWQADFKGFEKNIHDVLFDETIFLEDEKNNQDIKASFIQLALDFYAKYQQIKREMQVIDYSDMEHFAYKLLKMKMVQEEVRHQFQYIMVDEFQDTNDLQEAIISCFSREGNVFRVGDIKQSIYGFRQARPQIMKEHMDHEDQMNETIVMADNYRSDAGLIEFNNEFYSVIMKNPMGESQFGEKDISSPGTMKQKETEQIPVRFLFTQYLPWMEGRDVKTLEARRLHRINKADLIAQDILEHKKRGMPYRSMCILTRNHAIHEELKNTLETYGIPVLAEIDHGFYTNQAIQIILSALKVLVNPLDDIAMTAFLCSPLGGLSHERLASLAACRSPGESIYGALKSRDPGGSVLQAYRDILPYMNLPLGSLIKNLYNYKDYYYRSTSGQDKTNLDLLLEMAREVQEEMQLSEFLSLVEKEAGLDKTSEAYPFGKEDDVVKIKTMHHAKGLQFPLVYLYSRNEVRNVEAGSPILMDSDLGIAFESLDPSFHLRRSSRQALAVKTKKKIDEMQEEMRLLYVATTRAENELVIVDSIRTLDDYDSALNMRAMMKNRSYTSWFLHSFYGRSSKVKVKFDEHKELAERPEPKKKTYKWNGIRTYKKPVSVITSQTASGAKKTSHWQKTAIKDNTALERGTFFHEAAAVLSYPYALEDIKNLARRRNQQMNRRDLDQIVNLNQCPQYQLWMKHPHQFECSYVVNEKGRIVHGFMDLVIWMPDRIDILDFKTDFVSDLDTLVQRYRPQMEVYARAMHAIKPDVPVKTFIYSFHLGKTVEVLL